MALDELGHSEIESGSFAIRRFQRIFECLDSELSMGENGWVHEDGTIPSIGSEYPYGSFTIPPTAVRVDVDPRQAPSKSLVTVMYQGRR